jgi:hypothetical protein
VKIPQYLRWLGKFAVGGLLIAYILSLLDLRSVARAILDGDGRLYSVALFCFVFARLLEGYRFASLASGRRIPYGPVFEMTIKATFLNNFTLAVVGDAYRARWLRRFTADWTEAISVVVADRVLGLLIVIALAFGYLVVGRSIFDLGRDLGVQSGLSLPFVLAVASVGVAVLLLFLRRRLRGLAARVRSLVVRFLTMVREFTGATWLRAILATLAMQIVLAVMVLVLVRALGESANLSGVLFVMLLVYLAGGLPISIGALGVREGVMILGLPLLGVPVDTAATVALLSRVIMYLVALVGGIWLILVPGETATAVSAAPGSDGAQDR